MDDAVIKGKKLHWPSQCNLNLFFGMPREWETKAGRYRLENMTRQKAGRFANVDRVEEN